MRWKWQKYIKKLSLRLNATEYVHLQEQAEISGLKLEPLLRQLIMGVQLKLHPLDSYAKLIFEINCIGNNINQLAYKANGKGIATILEVKAARLMLAEILQLVKEKYG